MRDLEKLWKGREESGLRWDKEVQGNAPETEAEESGRMIGNGWMYEECVFFFLEWLLNASGDQNKLD